MFTSNAVVTRNTIVFNSSDNGGGLETIDFGSSVITENVVIGNTATNKGGGMVFGSASSPIVENNIVCADALTYDNTFGQPVGLEEYFTD